MLKINRTDISSLILFLFCILTLGFVYFIEIIMGIKPCSLCVYQRIPYFWTIALFLPYLILTNNTRIRWDAIFYPLVIIAFSIGMYFSVYQYLVEIGFVIETCKQNNFVNLLATEVVDSCSEVTMRILGFSLAFWNSCVNAAIIMVCIRKLIIEYIKYANGKR